MDWDYLVVYLIFVLSGDDTSLPKRAMKSHLGVSRTNSSLMF